MCFTEIFYYVVFFLFFLFFRTLLEKTAEPIIAKPEHRLYMPSVLRKMHKTFSVSYPLLILWAKQNILTPFLAVAHLLVEFVKKLGNFSK